MSFEDVESAIESGAIIGDFPHPNQERYPDQRVLVVEIDEYACIVPYIQEGNVRFLKTVYRSRGVNCILPGMAASRRFTTCADL